MSGGEREHRGEQLEGNYQAPFSSQLQRRGGSLSTLRDRQPTVPISPAGQASSLRVLETAGQSTPLSSPIRCPTADIRRKVSATNPNLSEKGIIALVSTESPSLEDIISEVFGAAGNIWTEKMADTGLKSYLTKLLEIEQEFVYAMRDLTIADVEAATIPYVKGGLDRILEQAKEFRKVVRSMKERHKEVLTPTDLGNLDGQVEKLCIDVRTRPWSQLGVLRS